MANIEIWRTFEVSLINFEINIFITWPDEYNRNC